MRGARRWPALLASLMLGLALAVSGAGQAQATALSISQCTTSYGAILAVDFGHWGGPVLRACGSTPTTGYTLLNQGGWVTTGTGHDGPGFICRIAYSGFNGGTAYPTPAQETCAHTPTGSLWSYWHADAGASGWTLSQDGAVGYSPKPGSVDAWIYGSSASTPSFTPDSVRAHNTSSPVVVVTGGSGSGGSGSGGSGSGSGSGSASTGSGGTTTGSGGSSHSAGTAASHRPGGSQQAAASTVGRPANGATAGSPTSGRSGAPNPETTMAHGKAVTARSLSSGPTQSAGASSSARLVDAAPVAKVTGGHRSPFAAIAAGVLILALVAAGAFTGLQRRGRTD